MSTKTEESPDSRDLFTTYREEITKLNQEIKGLKGQNARLKKKQGGNGGVSSTPHQESGVIEGGTSEQGVNQAPISHLARDYEKVCVDCGGENPNFKGAPNVFCNGPECHGRIPMGHVEKEQIVQKEGGIDLPTIGKCFNCGKDDQAVLVE